MRYEAFIDEVCWRAGLQDDRALAERGVAATLEMIGERLPSVDANGVADHLPAPLGAAIRRRRRHGEFAVEELFEHVREAEGVGLGFAVEHARVVCQVLAEILDAEGRTHLQHGLPPEWVTLFTPRESVTPEPPPPGPPPGHGSTLASGRPGSRRPLSEAAPSRGQTESVVVSANPHGDEKLSSAPGERLGATLAEERPGSEHPVSEAGPLRKND